MSHNTVEQKSHRQMNSACRSFLSLTATYAKSTTYGNDRALFNEFTLALQTAESIRFHMVFLDKTLPSTGQQLFQQTKSN